MIKWIVLSFVFSLAALAAEGTDPRPDMHVMAQEIASLQKYLVTDADFSSMTNEASIRKSLDTISQHLKSLKESAFVSDPPLQVNIGMLSQQITDANRAFSEGNKNYARYMVQSSLQMCIACHTRTKTPDFALPNVDLSGVGLMEISDYLFATRQFDKGRASFEEAVAGYPGNKVGYGGLRKALLSLAVYYARVKEDPKAGAEYFSKVAGRGDLPLYTQAEVAAWAQDFRKWSKEKPQFAKQLSEVQLLAEAKKLLRKDDLSLVADLDQNFHIRRLRASALLHRVLESPGDKSSTKGEALYYLGQIYHRVDSSLFFRFGEMYLKACVLQYKKTSIARNCYGALEEAITEGYTGSAGTDIPEDEQVELMRLKRLAF